MKNLKNNLWLFHVFSWDFTVVWIFLPLCHSAGSHRLWQGIWSFKSCSYFNVTGVTSAELRWRLSMCSLNNILVLFWSWFPKWLACNDFFFIWHNKPIKWWPIRISNWDTKWMSEDHLKMIFAQPLHVSFARSLHSGNDVIIDCAMP